MTRSTPEFEPRVADWLENDPQEAPREVLATVLAALPSINQARRGPLAPWRSLRMTTYTRLAAAALVAVVAIGGAIYLLQPAGGFGPGSPSTAPTPTVRPTLPVVDAGTIVLTDSGCTWEGNPGSITKSGEELRVRFSVRNQTDTFGNFGIYRLGDGRTWEEAASWIDAMNDELHGGPVASAPAGEFTSDVGSVDAPERKEYPASLLMDLGTHGIVCSSNEPPPGLVFGVYLVGPLEVVAP